MATLLGSSEVPERIRRRAVTRAGVWYWSAVAVSLVFVIGTFVAVWQSTDNLVLRKLLPTSENSPGALWSGFLLVLVAIHAYDGYALWRRRQPDVAKAWLSIAMVLLIFSADEIGSIHERVSLQGEALGIGSWFALLPFAIVVAALLGYAVALFWRAEGQRGTAIVVVLGFALLGSVALQEFLEHRIVLVSDSARAIRAAVEEGTELVGMLILLKLALANTAFAERRGVEAWPCLEAVRELCVPVTVMTLLLAPLLAVGTTMFEDGRGRIADWLAVVLLSGAALAVCRPYLRGEGSRLPAWILAAVCGVAALAILETNPGRVIWFGSVAVDMRLLTLAVLSPVAIVMWAMLHGRHSMRLDLLIVAVMANLMVLALLPLGATATYLVTQFLALAMYVALAGGESAWPSVAASRMPPPTSASHP
jgi:hypothetical protein